MLPSAPANRKQGRSRNQSQAGSPPYFGNSEDLSYTFNVVNQLSAIADADDSDYSCTVTCDANNNITQFLELQNGPSISANGTTTFTCDALNRLTQHKSVTYDYNQGDHQETQRNHTIDALGRTSKTNYKTYYAGDAPPAGDSLEHVYDRARFLQNYDGSSTYGERWHWAGAQNAHAAPLRSPNADTASQAGYNIANDKTPQRRTFLNPTSEGDERHLYGQGKPQAKNSSGSGANWYIGEESQSSAVEAFKVNSRSMFDGTVTATDMDRATDAREKGRIGIIGSAQAYAGSSGRVTSERIGRDLNPLGRGDGNAYVGGAQNLGRIYPVLPKSMAQPGWGNSVNNGCGECIALGTSLANFRTDEFGTYDEIESTTSGGFDPSKPVSFTNCDCFTHYCYEEVARITNTYNCVVGKYWVPPFWDFSQMPPVFVPGHWANSIERCICSFRRFKAHSPRDTNSVNHPHHCKSRQHDRTINCCAVTGGYQRKRPIYYINYIMTSCHQVGSTKKCSEKCVGQVRDQVWNLQTMTSWTPCTHCPTRPNNPFTHPNPLNPFVSPDWPTPLPAPVPAPNQPAPETPEVQLDFGMIEVHN